MDDGDGRAESVTHPFVAPRQKRHDHRVERATLDRECVFIARRALLVGNPAENAVVDEAGEALGHKVTGRPCVLAELLEAGCAEEGLAQQQQRPSIADHRQGAGDGAPGLADIGPLHPGRRDELIDLFDRAFVESQEATGMTIIGQFRDLDRADRHRAGHGMPACRTSINGSGRRRGGRCSGGLRRRTEPQHVPSSARALGRARPRLVSEGGSGRRSGPRHVGRHRHALRIQPRRPTPTPAPPADATIAAAMSCYLGGSFSIHA